MNDEESLSLLLDIAHNLEKTVKDLDYQIERAAHAIAESPSSVGHALSVLQDRQNAQAGYMYELGKVEARIEDIENRLRERGEQQQELAATQDWEREVPIATEDHLDWLRPTLDAPDVVDTRQLEDPHHHYEGEDRMLEEMHREGLEPEDYLDWWKR